MQETVSEKSKKMLEEAKESTNKACNSKDLGSVCDLDVNLLFMCVVKTREKHGFQAVQIPTSHYRMWEAAGRGLPLLGFNKRVYPAAGGCCITGTAESHSSGAKAIKAAYVPTLTYLNSQY